MKTAFIITSSINFKGCSSIEGLQRLQQVIHTIDSIKSRVENADIFLIDSSDKVLSSNELEIIPNGVTVLSVSQSLEVKKIQDESESVSQKLSLKYSSKGKTQEEVKDFIKTGYIKSNTEHFMIGELFEMYDFSSYDLVFKISGRYFLNDGFNISNYNLSGMTVKRIGTEDSIYTVLWSFSGNRFEEIKKSWNDLHSQMISKFKESINTDIEECMFLTYIKDKEASTYSLIKILGISGIVNNPFGKTLQNY